MTVWEVTLGLAFFFVLYLGALAIYELITIIDRWWYWWRTKMRNKH